MTSESLAKAFRDALTGPLFALQIDTVPSSSCRPRVSLYGTYYTKSYQTFLTDCTRAMTIARCGTLDGDLGVYLEVIIAKPKLTKLVRPRGDVDNYSKAPLDAAIKAKVWDDDGQVVALFATKRWTELGELPGVNILVGKIGSVRDGGGIWSP